MPVVDVEVVCSVREREQLQSASELANALGRTFGTSAGQTWVRLRVLDTSCYAENDAQLSVSELPVFVTVLHAHPPTGPALATEARSVTQCVAACLGRALAQIHVQYAPAGAGRQAFGGKLVS
jgi:hypothetical protein